MSLRDVTRSSAFALPLSEAMDRFHDYDSRLSPEERAKLLEEAEHRLDAGRASDAQESGGES